MRRCIATGLAAIIVAAASVGKARAFERPAVEASWEEQARAMGYLILHLSSVNAINGLNLSRDQAVRLRGMARDVEASGAKVPKLKGRFRPDLAEVRDTYMEVRKYVLAGKEVPDELEKRVAKARATESAVIRLSLTKPNYLKRSCLRCHSAPKVADVRTDRKTMAELQKTQCPVFTRKEKEVFLSHMGGVFGTRGLIKLGVLAPEVDRLLSDGQKEIMRTFACCLTPPKGLSDPVRAGQAAGGEREIEILRAVRKVPKFLWPLARDRGLRKLDQMLVFKQPGITEAKRKAICEQVGQLYDKARAMEEADFEMEKGELAVELKGVGESETKPGDKQSRYMTALFLLIPGSREVFDNVIKRIDAADRERQP